MEMPTDKELGEMVDQEIEYQEMEARKTPSERLSDLLKRQHFLLEQAMETCRLAEAELLAAKLILNKTS